MEKPSRRWLSLFSLTAFALSACQGAPPESGAEASNTGRAVDRLDDRNEPPPLEQEPEIEDPTETFDEPLVVFPIQVDWCTDYNRQVLTSVIDNVRLNYNWSDTTGWALTLVRTQKDGTKCIVSGSDGYARSDGDPEYRAFKPTTRHNIGSVSKVLAAMALLKAMDDHNVTWGEKIIDYLPADWQTDDPYIQGVNFGDLLQHKSGMAKLVADNLSAMRDWYGTADCSAETDTCVPNKKSYSNAGYVLVQYLFARIAYPDLFDKNVTRFGIAALGDQYLSGFLLETYVRQNFMEPWGITKPSCYYNEDTDSYAYLPGSKQEHATAKGDYRKSRTDHRKWCGTGGFSASSVDMARLLDLFHTHQNVPEYLKIFIEAQGHGFDGYRWTPSGAKYLSKGGLLPADDKEKKFKTIAGIFVDEDTSFTLTVNDDSMTYAVLDWSWDQRYK